MSKNLNVFSVMEPRVAFKDSMSVGQYALVKGAETYTYRNYPSNSCDNSGINFSTPPPSFTDVCSRLAVLEFDVNLLFSGPGTPLNPDLCMIQSNRDAFRAFPIESVTKNMAVSVNGENLPCNINQVCHPFSRYHLDVDYLNQGITPNMLDTFAKYSDGDASSKNPLGWYSENSAQNARGAYTDYTIVSNTNTSAEIKATLRTYIMMSPFEWLSAENNVVPGLTQLISLDWNINFAPNLQRIWSRSDTHPVPVTNLQVTIGSTTAGGNGNANLKLLWMTPRPDMKKYIARMPEIKYPYFSTNRFTTSGDIIAPNNTKSITSQVINFINVPNAIYIYVIRDESSYTNTLNGNLLTTDTYFAIDNIDITLANVTGILSNASPQQLYDIAVRNRLRNTTFSEFIGTTNPFNQLVSTFSSGSKVGLSSAPIRLVPGEDFSLPDDLAPGVQSKVDFQVTVLARNINQSESIKAQLCVLVVYEGYLQIYNGTARTMIGPLLPKDVESNNYVELDWNALQNNYGGALGDRFRVIGKDLSKYATKANKFLKDTKIISKGTKAASHLPTRFSEPLRDVSEFADKYGYGECCGGMLVEEQRGLVGGKAINKKKLKSRLKKRK